ncbi:MAG TPA: glutamate--tRNA ligase [Thermoanaerobaculia bacterium]|nr:glutamate--tRNA ligase [Thermoanaerobaculia bacterium]
MARPPRLRFAPSPTGFLHVGGARTAIFNLLHARRHGGTMVLRIEDTDLERSRRQHAEQILESLAWLGAEWDEGPIRQSDRLDRYRERALELVARGAAYRCFCTVEELENERGEAEARGRQYRYSGRCRSRADADPSAPHVVRFRVEPGTIRFHDRIRGEVEFEGELIDDFVLLRSDGHPTYHLSVVVDDIDMDITLVARGEDHLSNTPKHVLLFRALGAEVPEFAHVPLILGPDRKRLSKRTGATSVEEYRNMGVLPQALFNFLLLLGWSPGEDRELITREEAARLFDIGQVHRSPAVFDLEKLLWMNHQYMQRMEARELAPLLEPLLAEPAEDRQTLTALVRMLQPRARTLREMAEMAAPMLAEDDGFEYEEEAVRKHLRGEDLEARMQELRDALAGIEPFELGTTEQALRALAEARGVAAAKYIHPLRLALTGRGASPPIFDVIDVLGREKTLARLDRLLARIPALRSGS